MDSNGALLRPTGSLCHSTSAFCLINALLSSYGIRRGRKQRHYCRIAAIVETIAKNHRFHFSLLRNDVSVALEGLYIVAPHHS